jgi:molecular chaperone GrpE
MNEWDDDKEEINEKGSQQQGSEQSHPETEALTKALEERTKEAAELKEKYLRTYADFDNYRKRAQRDMADFRRYANEQLMLEMLPVVDHLGLALKHANEAGANEAGSRVQGLQQGVELVFKQLRDVMEKFGVKQFSAEGEVFDPAKHEAVMQTVTADVPENTVVQVFQEGYLYHDKVLRHAKVSVAKKPQPEQVGATKD